jgi:GT2 family glycosyltransferase
MMIKRSVLENVGLFDLDYQNYMEDYDFCYRVTSAGYKIGYVPTARIYHKDSLTGGKNPKRRRWYIGRNTVLFYRKNNRFPVWNLWSFMAWLSLREVAKGNLKHLPDYWQGFKDGFRFLAR